MTKATITGPLQQILKNPQRFEQYAQEAYGSPLLRDVSNLIDSTDNAQVLSFNSNRMTYAIKRMSNRGVIDLKPFFKRSSHAKPMKGGGWYLRVPIQQGTRDIIKKFGRSKYDEMKQQFNDYGSMSATLSINDLFAKPNAEMNTLSPLSYTPKSNNVTQIGYRTKSGNVRNTYVMFRTVSSKSEPSSWILNRNNLNEDNTSKRLQDDINALINNRMRQIAKLNS